MLLPASRCLSIMNIYGARRAGCRRRKACMGWSWAAACGVQGRGHIARLPAQLVICYFTSDGVDMTSAVAS